MWPMSDGCGYGCLNTKHLTCCADGWILEERDKETSASSIRVWHQTWTNLHISIPITCHPWLFFKIWQEMGNTISSIHISTCSFHLELLIRLPNKVNHDIHNLLTYIIYLTASQEMQQTWACIHGCYIVFNAQHHICVTLQLSLIMVIL